VKYCETCRRSFSTDLAVCPDDQTPLGPPDDFTPGQTIRGKYEIVDKIGAGGMAVVYRARHLAFGETFALKVMSRRLTENAEFLRRFKTEAIISRKLRHPNAVRVDDLDFAEDGRPYIVMEYVQGASLRHVIQVDGSLGVPRALNIARQVCAALIAAHELGIVHRDIKPDNILLVTQPDGSEVAKVLDFGIAKVRDGAMDLGEGFTETQTGTVVGTPQYISPEQALGMKGDAIDGRADIYSLGVVLYEMLTGDLPFHSDTAMGIILHHIQTPPRPPRELRPDVGIPQTLSDLLMKALAKDPTRRFANAQEMLQALNRPHALGAAIPATRPSAPRAVAGPGSRVSSGAITGARLPANPRMTTAQGTLASASLRASAAEPVFVRSGTNLPDRWVLTVGAFGLVLIILVMMCPAPPKNLQRRPAAGANGGPTMPPLDHPAPGVEADGRIVQEIRRRFREADTLKGATFEFSVSQGVVTLTGVATTDQTRIASSLVETIDGVREVKASVRAAAGPAPAVAAAPEPATTAAIPVEATEAPPDGTAGASGDPRARELVSEGQAAIARGDYDVAIRSFRAALDIDPSFTLAEMGLRQAEAAKTKQ
jgi:serine/threonine protein kinase